MQHCDEVAVVLYIKDFDFPVVVFGYEHILSILGERESEVITDSLDLFEWPHFFSYFVVDVQSFNESRLLLFYSHKEEFHVYFHLFPQLKSPTLATVVDLILWTNSMTLQVDITQPIQVLVRLMGLNIEFLIVLNRTLQVVIHQYAFVVTTHYVFISHFKLLNRQNHLETPQHDSG